MPADVTVRAETPMLGLAWRQVVTVTRSPLVEAAIAEGRLTVVTDDGEPAPLKGAALDAALEAAGLPTSEKADEKRARLTAHQAAQAAAAAGPADTPDDEGTPATASTAAPRGATLGPATPPTPVPPAAPPTPPTGD